MTIFEVKQNLFFFHFEIVREISIAKELFVMCVSEDEKDRWIVELKNRLKQSGERTYPTSPTTPTE